MARASPFAGMDPWLQSFWGTVHTALCADLGNLLNELMGSGLVAVAQQRVIVEASGEGVRGVYPDVHVLERRAPRPTVGGDAGGGVATLDEPTVVRLASAAYEQPYLEIVDASSGGRVVTVIEFVSPSNRRPGDGRDQYVRKQSEVVASSANLVEVDLIRARLGVTLAWKHSAAVALDAAYHVCAQRAGRRSELEVYPVGLRQRLPSIRIPLREGDADVRVDLQAVIDDVYRRGRMSDLIDYSRPPEPPLDDADSRWATETVAAWRARGAAQGG